MKFLSGREEYTELNNTKRLETLAELHRFESGSSLSSVALDEIAHEMLRRNMAIYHCADGRVFRARRVDHPDGTVRPMATCSTRG